MAAPAGARSSALTETTYRRGRGCQPGRHQSEQNGGERGDQRGKGQYRTVQPNLFQAGQSGGAVASHEVHTPNCDRERERPGQKGQEEVLGDELPQDPEAAGADGGANRDL